jgi:hypothetical protein
MHDIFSSLTGAALATLVCAVPCMVADHLTGTALWSRTNNPKRDIMGTLNSADRYDVFPTDDDEMAALAELAAPAGNFFGLHVLTDGELAELAAQADEIDQVDDYDVADYLADVYGSITYAGIDTEWADGPYIDSETGISYY